MKKSTSRKFTVVATSDGSQVGTHYTPWISGGYIESIQYVKAGSGGYTDGVDFTITADVTGEAIWVDTNINASEVVRPRAPTCTTAGVAALYAASGEVNDRIAIAADRVKIVLAAAGASKTGTFVITVSDA
jgi:hypothetical protein